jgi:elongator complex protein 5
MMDTSTFFEPNFDWEAAFKRPEFVKAILSDDGKVPKWFSNLRYYQEVLVSRPGILDTKGPRGPRKIQPRAIDCGGWIKKNNSYTGGIRKRRVEGRKPAGMPRPITLDQYQRHCIHLMSKVLSLRTNASPFTLVLDDLNQRASVVMSEFIRRAHSRNINVVVVSFENTTIPGTHLIPAYAGLSAAVIFAEIERAMRDFKESLVVVDCLHTLLNVENMDVNELFLLVVHKFASTLIGIYHQDLLPEPNPDNAYVPQSLEVMKFMATSIITCKSLAQALAVKAAKERSLPEPTFGLLQGAEGIVQCLNANDNNGVVLEAEFRHKSGRPESETYFLRLARVSDYNDSLPNMLIGTLKKEFVILLSQLPAYANEDVISLVSAAGNEMESTFNLGLTDRQRVAREGVVLPYFDAQNANGGEGGRILYDMGTEDDFDEEEDEI